MADDGGDCPRVNETCANEAGLFAGAIDDGEVVGCRADAPVHDHRVEAGACEELVDFGEGDGQPAIVRAGVAGHVDGGGRQQSGNRSGKGT